MLLGDICRDHNIKFDDIMAIRLEEDGHRRPVFMVPEQSMFSERTFIDTGRWSYIFIWMKDYKFADIKIGMYVRYGSSQGTL